MPEAIDVGHIVKYDVPGEDHYASGLVIARETYTDMNGTREWLYVRWFNSDGKPDDEALKHARRELIRA